MNTKKAMIPMLGVALLGGAMAGVYGIASAQSTTSTTSSQVEARMPPWHAVSTGGPAGTDGAPWNAPADAN